jgi:hypothetical protein
MRIRNSLRSLAPLDWAEESRYLGIMGSAVWLTLCYGGDIPLWVAAIVIAVWELGHLWWNAVPALPATSDRRSRNRWLSWRRHGQSH